MEWSREILDCDDSADFENIQRILAWLNKTPTPGAALDALENLLKVAYPGAAVGYTCAICGLQFHAPKRSGKPPTICGRDDCQKEANRRRVAKHRGKL